MPPCPCSTCFPIPPCEPACSAAVRCCSAVRGVRRSDSLGRPSRRDSCSFVQSGFKPLRCFCGMGPTLLGNSLLCLCFNEHFVRVVNPRFQMLGSTCPVYYLLRSSRVHLASHLTQSWCEDCFERSDHRRAVFTPHARVPQAVDRMNFAYQACPNSGFSCSHVALRAPSNARIGVAKFTRFQNKSSAAADHRCYRAPTFSLASHNSATS